MTPEEFRNIWQKSNPNIIHIPSVYELGLMEAYAKYYHEQQVKTNVALANVSGISSDFEKDLFKLINAYTNKGLSKFDLVSKMNWATGNCQLS